MKACPLSDITAPDGSSLAAQPSAGGWFVQAAGGVTARLKGLRDGMVCRVEQPSDRDVVQLSIGPATSALCNAVYSPAKDLAIVMHADDLCIEPLPGGRGAFGVSCGGPLQIRVIPDYLKLHRNLPWFQPMDRRFFPRPPAGWCSWYCYGLGITEEATVKNTDWLAENLRPFGCDWVQIDDGWQGRGCDFGTNRDWFVTCEKDFPQGMKWISDYIRAKGMRPGIWCIPFTQSDTELYKSRPELFVHRPDGTSPGERATPLDYEWMPVPERMFEWSGRYFIDATGAVGQEYIKKLFEMLCDQWGYDYVKIDAQAMVASFYDEHRKRLADPSLDGPRAYRAGLEAMRGVMGGSRFLLNCGHGWTSAGLCEGIRIGGDVHTNWAGMQQAITSTMQHLYLNTVAFYTDPDVVCVRDPLTFEQGRVWATLVAVTGQLLMASDIMHELPADRVEILRRIFPVADIRPMELYPLDGVNRPRIFDVKVRKAGVGEWDVVALFNWDEKRNATLEISPKRLGLPEGRYIWIDAWSGTLLYAGEGARTLEVPTTACRVVAIWPDLGRPQFVGTSRHITQGADDAASIKWDEKKGRLSGAADVVGGDPYRVRIHVPAGWRVATKGLARQGELAVLTLNEEQSATVRWHVDFEK